MILQYILLGIVQGLTEFLPVSSTGHLVVIQKLLKIEEHSLAIDIVLHLATLLSVLISLRSYIWKAFFNKKIFAGACIATVITGAAGFLGADFFESVFSSTRAVAIAWMFTGLILLLTRAFQSPGRKMFRLSDAVAGGAAQAVAIIPGVSRSGATISGLIFKGLAREEAFSFSFLISIPAIVGSVLFKWRDIRSLVSVDIAALAAAFVFAFVTGLAALIFVRKALLSMKFHYFGYYCLAAGIATFFLFRS